MYTNNYIQYCHGKSVIQQSGSYTSTLDINRNKLVKCYTWRITLLGAESWALRTVDQKYLERFEKWCWRKMEKISWTDHVRNVEVLQRRIEEERNILQTKK
jgi:hypothetical protein